MNRRKLLQLFATVCTGILASGSDTVGKEITINSIEIKKTRPPHAEALALILEKKAEEIADAELRYFSKKGTGDFKGPVEEYWWNDELSRKWRIVRPFVKTSDPASDKRPIFLVFYEIEDTEVIQWFVDIWRREVRSHIP